VEFLERETLLWPPNSPDSNPVDYSVWSILQEKVYKTRISDFDDLKQQRIRNEWAELDHAVIAALCVSGVVVFQFDLCEGGRWSFRALLLIRTLCFCDNWGLRSLVESNSCRLIFRSDFLAVVSYDAVHFNA